VQKGHGRGRPHNLNKRRMGLHPQKSCLKSNKKEQSKKENPSGLKGIMWWNHRENINFSWAWFRRGRKGGQSKKKRGQEVSSILWGRDPQSLNRKKEKVLAGEGTPLAREWEKPRAGISVPSAKKRVIGKGEYRGSGTSHGHQNPGL